MNNDPISNTVFVANIAVGGNFTFGAAYSTGGQGGHVGPDVNQPNALASQGGVKVTDDKMTVVNAGSNTVSLYQIDFVNPAFMRPLGPPVDSAGEFPVATSIGQVNHNTCILNAGAVNTVACFTLNLRTGLQPIPNTLRSLNQTLTTPPANQDFMPNEVFFNCDQTKLFVTIKGGPNGAPGALITWDVNQADFSLSDFPIITPTPSGTSMTQIKDSPSVFTNAIGQGVAVFQITDGVLVTQEPPVAQPIVAIPGSIHNAWSEDSAFSGNYYMVDSEADQFTEVAVDPNTLVASIVQAHALPAGGSCMDTEILELDGGDTMFVLCAGTKTMEIFTIGGPGDITQIDSVDLAAIAAQVGVPFDTANVQGNNGFQASG